MENLQNVDSWVWVAVVVGLLLVIGLAVLAKASKSRWDHSRAETIRTKVEQELPKLREGEALALESEAQAERARAQAERLEAQASQRRSEVEDQRSTLNEQLRAADERDPLVESDADAHRHVDESARRD